MEISSKRSRGCRAGDRLSNLPDCVLHSILSHLKARQVVQTCALSRRWRHLWLEVPCIDITTGEFRIVRSADGSPQEEHGIEQEAEFGKFEDFVDNLLFHRSAAASSSQLDTLRLHIEDKVPQDTTYGRWIRHGLKFSPAMVDVSHGGNRSHIRLPPLAPTSTHRLTKLRLDRVILPSNFGELQLPVLEDLEIRSISIDWLSGIASSSLKNLTIDCYRCVTYRAAAGRGLDAAFVVLAPRLASLRLGLQLSSPMDGSYRDITVAESPSLCQASIRLLNNERLDGTPETYSYLLRTICKLLSSLSNVSTLELSGFKQTMVAAPTEYPPRFQTYSYGMASVPASMLQAILDDKNHGLPMFRNLKTMTFVECEIGGNMEMLCRFLHNTPAIQNLIMQHCKFVGASERKKLKTDRTRLSTASNLRLVEIKYKDDDDDDDYYDLQGRRTPASGGRITRQRNEIFSRMKEIVPATTMIRATETN